MGFAHLMDKFTDSPHISRRDSGVTAKTELVEILYFRHFYEHFTFGETDWSHRGKCLHRYIRVAVAVNLDTVTTKPEEKTSE